MFPFNMVIITSTKKKKKKMGQILIFKNILALHFYNSVFSSVKWRNYRDVQSVVKNIRILLVKFDKLSKQTITISFREI